MKCLGGVGGEGEPGGGGSDEGACGRAARGVEGNQEARHDSDGLRAGTYLVVIVNVTPLERTAGSRVYEEGRRIGVLAALHH